MTDEVDEVSAASRGSAVMAYAVIDDEGVQHSLWFLEKDATSEAAMVGGTVVRLGHPTLTDEELRAIRHGAISLRMHASDLSNAEAVENLMNLAKTLDSLREKHE